MVDAIATRVLPEWQVFVRRPDGRAEHFTVTRKRQLLLMAGIAAMAFWAGTATTLLSQKPEELAEKSRELEELMASTRAAQHRLAAAEKMVGEIAREVDSVHTNLTVLAESSDTLAKDRPAAKGGPALARLRVASDPAYDDDSQTGASEARRVRERVRQLETSLDRLRQAYAGAVQQTAETAGNRISETEKQLSRLGLDAARLTARRSPGQGGPFIPLRPGLGDEVGMGALIERMQQWNGVKAALQKLPLAEPIRGDYDFNSGFGTRNDPLNKKTGVHEGIDLGASTGTPVYATGEGVVTLAGPWDRYGNTVEIAHGAGIVSRYAHLSRIKVRDGQRVTRSTVIGLVGNTGRSTGPHLHYEVRVSDAPKDPVKFISAGRDVPKAR
ncbi:M23 family metallopeptidase [Magnetospirillum sp. UT-4]|uniref:M23 family metallopeptidase n=1 Tax=Magnetospirillum sp. UT-4 TaxID=2681467 RepID=UPI0020C50817|nr:M23 family metallopeptidase [Magnetospirillum sp. UT-4]